MKTKATISILLILFLLSGCITMRPSRCLLALAPAPGKDAQEVIDTMHRELSERSSITQARADSWIVWYAEYLHRHKANDLTTKELINMFVGVGSTAGLGMAIYGGLKSININDSLNDAVNQIPNLPNY